MDSKGNLYGTTEEAADGDGTVFELAKGSGTINARLVQRSSNGAGPSTA